MRQHAGGSHNEQRIAKCSDFVIAGEQAVARRKGDLHAVGKTDDHDQWRHHVQKNIQAEAKPAERAESQQDRHQWRAGRDDHERYAAEEQDRDQAADRKTKRIVDQPVALDRVANLELHHGHAREIGSQAGTGEMFLQLVANIANDGRQPAGTGRIRLQGKHHQGQLAIWRQHFVANDFIRHHAFDERLVFGALRQRIGEKRRGNLPVVGRLARGEYRDQSPCAIDQLNPDRKIAQFLQRIPFQQSVAFDHDEDVKFVRREPARDFFVCPEFIGIGSEQLTQ